MKKYLILLALFFFIPNAYASQFTTNYNLEVPAIGDWDWQSIISKDIISIDSVLAKNGV